METTLLVGDTYSTGFLPPWTGLWYRVSEYPVLLGVLAALALSILSYAAWRVKKAATSWRAHDSLMVDASSMPAAARSMVRPSASMIVNSSPC